MRKILIALFLVNYVLSFSQTAFVRVQNGKFTIGDDPYYYIGTNFWYGMNLGSQGEGGNRERLIRELDLLKENGVTNLRVIAASEGPDTEPYRIVPALLQEPNVYNAEVLEGLDFLLNEMAKRNLKAVVCLGDMWPWSGGFGQFLVWSGVQESIPYPPPHAGGTWDNYQQFTTQFFENDSCIKMYNDHVSEIVNRTNSISGVAFKNDPTIMAWELCNEPRGLSKTKAYQQWIKNSSDLIRSLDANHLITIGSEGETAFPTYVNNDFIEDHAFENIDYATIHIWIENWDWYNPEKTEETFDKAVVKAKEYLIKHVEQGKKLGKPIVLEEFGIARDNRSYDPTSLTKMRDKYYKIMFDEVYELAKSGKNISGANFWAFGGEGRPMKPYGLMWKPNHDFIGDPPHEHQGWYSVYDTDLSTLKIIKKAAKKMSKL